MALTATQIIDQAMKAAGDTRIQAWGLVQLNAILRHVYRGHPWPFLMISNETLVTTPAQAYTDYSGLTAPLWKPQIMQIRSGTELSEVLPKKGGLPAYFADTSRLRSSGRPGLYALDRRNSRIYWADSVPSAAETISLFYQTDESDIALAGTPRLVTHTRNGDLYLIHALLRDMKVYLGAMAEAQAVSTLAKMYEDAMGAEKLDDADLTPQANLNEAYA